MQTENPRHEDIECLCKLLTTVGEHMDASRKAVKQLDDEGKLINVHQTNELMGAYFKRIDDLTKNDALDSRHRFMLQDLIELRRNSWVLRRKVCLSWLLLAVLLM
jgi:translation initiation factor 4G